MLTMEIVTAVWFPILLAWAGMSLLLLFDRGWLVVPLGLGKALIVLLFGGAVVTAMFNWFGVGIAE